MRRDLAAALRVTVVAALLLVAALGTSGRRHLSWRDLLGAPRDALATTALLLVGALVVAGMVRAVVEAWRRRRKHLRAVPGAEEDRYAEEYEVPRRTMVIAGVVAVVLALAVAVPAGIWLSHQTGRTRVVNETTGGARGGRVLVSPSFAAILAAALVLLVAAAVFSYLSRRAHARTALRLRRDGTARTRAADEAVADAATAAQETLASFDDVRSGIIAAYEAMVAVLAGRGAERRPADTAEDLLRRALEASSVPPAAGRDLTELFHEARFSSHPMGPRERGRAEQALREVVASTSGERVGAGG